MAAGCRSSVDLIRRRGAAEYIVGVGQPKQPKHRIGEADTRSFWQVFGNLNVKTLPKTGWTRGHQLDARHKESAPGLGKY
jgi:hypothetical protein